ncbi:MAG: DEAD/DEAH box helicase [Ardenticatenales bacterium]|nr:DEAD/DEAH box helicase [Ardenticatenales bacterium]
MKQLRISPRETVDYRYDPTEDRLEIRFSDASTPTAPEAVPHAPHVTLQRDTESGAVSALRVDGVQQLILERLVTDLIFELRPMLSPPVPAPAASPRESVAAPTEPVAEATPSEAESAASDRVPAPLGDDVEATAQSAEQADAKLGDQDVEHGAALHNEEAEHGPRPKRRRRRGGRRRRKQRQETPATDEPSDAASNDGDDDARAVQSADTDEATPTAADRSETKTDAASSRRRTRRGRKGNRGQEAEEEPSARDEPLPADRSAPIEGLDAPESFAFMGLHPNIGQVITVLDFTEPTPIQRRAVPEAMAGRDIIGLSQTGTGKTLAFLVPALHKLATEGNRRHQPRVLVLTPTRELAVQVADEANTLAMHTDLRVATLYGGAPMGKQIRELKRGADLIVATPGRLMDHMRRRNVTLDTVDYLVLDEADRMLDMGFLPDVRTILRDLPRERQTLFFSATMPPPIESLSLEMQREPVLVEVARQKPAEGIEQLLFPVERHLKLDLLLHLLRRDAAMGRVLVFTETKSEADIVGRKLKEQGVNVEVMHGDLNQRQRERALSSLADGTARILVATNVAARGLDIDGITHIVNYDVPQGVDEYVHRIGRTARADAKGHAFTFATTADEGMVKRIEGALEKALPRQRVEEFDYDVETPSWAKPSAEEITALLTKPATLGDRFKSMMGRRR